MKEIITAAAIWNIFTFMLMGIDKRKAVKDKKRIRESTLIGSAFLMGAFGITAGALFFHHKTRKLKFKILLPCAILVNIVIIIGLFW